MCGTVLTRSCLAGGRQPTYGSRSTYRTRVLQNSDRQGKCTFRGSCAVTSGRAVGGADLGQLTSGEAVNGVSKCAASFTQFHIEELLRDKK
ncbi:hypothetical protein ElyMa_005609300 [Elysia marginata]|uniref:Uncharacterized protein n=1 Tax=Elysia marginata TaxID=1093978 RepID=A0AAV4F503_9GAST|nr:hypothetical protein ElyMa_005609300 [Elysia marginata]